jgi:hypothetical protein
LVFLFMIVVKKIGHPVKASRIWYMSQRYYMLGLRSLIGRGLAEEKEILEERAVGELGTTVDSIVFPSKKSPGNILSKDAKLASAKLPFDSFSNMDTPWSATR